MSLLPRHDRKAIKSQRKNTITEIPTYKYPGAPKPIGGNTSRTFFAQKGATHRRNHLPHLRAQAVPEVRNDFPAPAKTGTIAPFFIKAPALETREVVIGATVRCSDATLALLATACPSRPCWLSVRRYASLAQPGRPPTSRSAPEHMRTAHG